MASSIAAVNLTYQQAQDLQRDLERTLQKLERAGLLREIAGDEVRTIVAEDVADHFGERYRSYPAGTRSGGLEIRRDAVPKTCVLKGRGEDDLPAAKQKQQSEKLKAAGVATTTKSSPEKTVASPNGEAKKRVHNWVATVTNGSSRSSSPEKKGAGATKDWGSTLTSATDTRWEAIFAAKALGSASSNSSPIKPVSHVKTASPVQAITPVKTSSPVQAVRPTQAVQSAQAVRSIHVGTPVKISSTVKAVNSGNTLRPVQAVDAPSRNATPPVAENDNDDLISFSP